MENSGVGFDGFVGNDFGVAEVMGYAGFRYLALLVAQVAFGDQ